MLLGHARQHGPNQEDENGNQVKGAVGKQVGQFAEHRQGDRPAEQVGRENPAVKVQASQIGHDGGHDRTHDQRVQGGQKQGQQGGQNQEQAALGGKMVGGHRVLFAYIS